MMWLNNFFEALWDNKQWLFSGIGITAGTLIVWGIRHLQAKRKPAAHPFIQYVEVATLKNPLVFRDELAGGPCKRRSCYQYSLCSPFICDDTV